MAYSKNGLARRLPVMRRGSLVSRMMPVGSDGDPQVANALLTSSDKPATVADLQAQLNRFSSDKAPENARFTTKLASGKMDMLTMMRAGIIMQLRGSVPGGEDIFNDGSKYFGAGHFPGEQAAIWFTANLSYVTQVVAGYADINHLPAATGRTVWIPGLGKVPVPVVIGAVVVSGLLLFGRRRSKR